MQKNENKLDLGNIIFFLYIGTMHTLTFLFALFLGSGDSVNLCESIDTMLEEFVSSHNQFYTQFYRCSQRLRDHVTACVYWHTATQG